MSIVPMFMLLVRAVWKRDRTALSDAAEALGTFGKLMAIQLGVVAIALIAFGISFVVTVPFGGADGSTVVLTLLLFYAGIWAALRLLGWD